MRTSDIDEARERVGRVFCAHKLEYLRPRHRLDMRQHVARFGNLALSYITYGADVSIDPGELSTFFLVHLIPTGPRKSASAIAISSDQARLAR